MTLVNKIKVRFIACSAVFMLACLSIGAQVGPGTPGKIAKFESPNSVGDSGIVEDKYGSVGVGTSLPTSKLTVAGMIESQSAGFKFPDGTIQTSAIKDPVLSAFQTDLHLDSGATSGSFAVPSNKRLVIEYVSIRATTPNGSKFLSFAISTTVNGENVRHHVIPEYSSSGVSHDLFILQNKVRIYADTEFANSVGVSVNRSSPEESGIVDVTISGYLVDLPAAARATSGAKVLESVKTAKRKF